MDEQEEHGEATKLINSGREEGMHVISVKGKTWRMVNCELKKIVEEERHGRKKTEK